MKKIVTFLRPGLAGTRLFATGASLIIGLLFSGNLLATDYYVAPGGNDTWSGKSAGAAWKSLSKVNGTTFLPGDRLLFEASGTWLGELHPLGSGSPGSPVIIDSFGTGNLPLIVAPGTNGSASFSLNDQSYWEISHLEMTNTQSVSGNAQLYGVKVNTSLAAGIAHVYILDCYIHDIKSITNESNSNFNKGTGGIIFTGLTNEVLIKGNHVKDVGVEGIRNSSGKYCAHFVVDSNLIENVYGDGIVLHGVNAGSAITRNVLRNVCYNTSSANYAGAWTYLSEGTLVAYNEISGIKGGGVNDGQPFDADINTNGDVFEYNYTHDNAKGFMLFMPDATNITVRYNVSVNDIGDSSNNKRLFNYTVTGNNHNKIYNNTFYINAATVNYLFQGGFIGTFSNNIIYATGNIQSFASKAVNTTSIFTSNCFYPSDVTKVNGPQGTVTSSIYASPGFLNAGYHGDGITGVVRQAYSLSQASVCRQSGVMMDADATLDFAGHSIKGDIYAAIGAIWPTDLPKRVETDIPVLNDTYTYDGSKTSNFGTDTHLQSKFGGGYAPEGTSTAKGYSRRTYLKFASTNLRGVANINKVYVRVRYFSKDGTYGANGTMISLSRSASWSESGINWNNQDAEGGLLDSLGYTLDDGNAKPASAPSPMTSAFINNSTHYVYLDVTDTVLSMLKNNTLPQDLSFVLQGICTSVSGGSTPIGNTGYSYFSREFTNASGQQVDSLAPALVIYAANGALMQGGTTYYVDPVSGDDTKSGTSAGSAWKTLDKINSFTFQGGDSLLIMAGSTFTGALQPKGSGIYGAPITISRYGNPAAPDPVINGGDAAVAPGAALTLTDQSYWEINHLQLTNNNAAVNAQRNGLLISNTSATAQQRHIFIKNCNILDVNSGNGAGNTTGGIVFKGSFDSVMVQECRLTNLGEQGVQVGLLPGNTAGLSSNVILKGNQMTDIGGDGIFLADIATGALIDSNTLVRCASTGLPQNLGSIVILNSAKSILMHNEVRLSAGKPAFYIGAGSDGSVCQYNYTHNNPRGILALDGNAASTVFRFNVSQGDGSANQLFVDAGSSTHPDFTLYNNTFYIGSGVSTTLFAGAAAGDFTVHFYNNIVSLGGGTLSAFAAQSLNTSSHFSNNCLYPGNDFKTAANYFSTQTQLLLQDPLFTLPGGGAEGLSTTSSYALQSGSICGTQGVLIADNGGLDFAGTPISDRQFLSIGAYWPVTAPKLATTTIIAAADAYTYDRDKAGNFGSEPSLVAKFGGGFAPEGTTTANGYSRRTYLKFSTTELKNTDKVQRVYLRMAYYAKDNNYSVNGLKVSLSRLTSWQEQVINWDNQAASAGLLDSIGYVMDDGLAKQSSAPNPVTDAFIKASSRYIYLDVTDTVLAMLHAGTLPGDLSIVLQGLCTSIAGPNGSSPIGNTGYTFFSRDFINTAGAGVDSLKPALVVYAQDAAVPLPIRASLLQARLNGATVRLNWTDYGAIAANGYIIERSMDGILFKRLTIVDGSGANPGIVDYAYEDKSPLTGHVYYRWQQVDAAGKVINTSNTVQVFIATQKNQVLIYPNPVRAGSSFKIRVSGAGSAKLNIYMLDATGRPVRRLEFNPTSRTQTISLSTDGLSTGLYFVTVRSADGHELAKLKVIVE